HFVGMIDDHTMAVKRLNMIPLEVIVRNRAAGSIVRRYPFQEGQTFDTPLIVMDYKDDSRHDPMINDDIIIALGLLSRDEIQHVRHLALAVNRHLKELFTARGLDLVDFKIEFGRFGDTILLGDEISMDSMRLWDVKTGASLDKDVYRYDKGDVLSAYAKVVDMMIPKEVGGVQ
ncbi:MAG: phosphoribosylaminoimidazolesuccinocarboxamide synthase, partial [Methanomicrobiales archaeon]|nr:phosphoribosylaminoimidazolesuccinocarboxamide synthase [Methanomicrobiales archaeon]